MSAGPLHAAAGVPLALLPLAAMWLAMMTAMMAPAAWPWVRAFDRLHRGGDRAERWAATGAFVGGYAAAWSVYALAAAAIQRLLIAAGTFDPIAGLTPWAGAGVLVAAGLFQFAPLKRACLAHCRSPLTYFLARWRRGPGGGFRMGFGHGVYCVGCCWALMATSLAVGVMSLWWMALLTAAVAVEQGLARGDRIRVPLGVALIAAGLRRV